MSHINIPQTIAEAPENSREMLEAVNQQLGVVPNLFRLISISPEALEGYTAMSGALAKGKLTAATRERIALAVAEINTCSYCLSAHTYLATNLAKLSDEEVLNNRKGNSLDAFADVAVRFAVKVTKHRGQISAEDVAELYDAGYGDAELIEIIQHVALNTWTNYLNEVVKTKVDFPLVVPF